MLNELLIRHALTRLAAADTPYFIIGDFNVDPVNSESLTTAIELGTFVDIAKDLCDGSSGPTNTFAQGGVREL